MKTQTREEMAACGATPAEIDGALELFELLKPSIRVRRNGRIDTAGGDKTILGLYRIVGRVYQETRAVALLQELHAAAAHGHTLTSCPRA